MRVDNIRFENLTFGFENNAKIFQNTTFDFPLDQIVWIKGESGAGRSTLLQLQAGLLIPEQGAYVMNGENVSEMSFEEFLPYRLNIGYGFDLGGVLYNKTLEENLTLPLLYHKVLSPNEAAQRAMIYMEDLGISKYQHLRPSVVPGGVRKLVCLIRALIMHPQILLLDDPSVGLGQETALKFFDLVDELRQQGELRHVFLSSFDDKLMSVVNPTMVAIDNGQLYLHEAEDDSGEKKAVAA
ncbi:MAG: ATP-binding cassette domain-containing protein [Bdellovibrionaceae bacterium]|nr:ATP-binding cassette domain-containing protein [Pseudobdellovibrionaceae bacterium]